MGRPTKYSGRDLREGETKTITARDAAYRKSMELSNEVFLNRLFAAHEEAGRRVA